MNRTRGDVGPCLLFLFERAHNAALAAAECGGRPGAIREDVQHPLIWPWRYRLSGNDLCRSPGNGFTNVVARVTIPVLG
jgi:hypothetical protein